MTLRELLERSEDEMWASDEFHAAIEAWAYGSEEECGDCYGAGSFVSTQKSIALGVPGTESCKPCHGTGKVKTPGLQQRIVDRLNYESGASLLTSLTSVLRQELGSE